MSSPDHPTTNLEDAFSSNFPNYVPLASPDYIPTSLGKTYSRRMPPKRALTTEAPAMTQDAIRKVIANLVHFGSYEASTATMSSASNLERNTVLLNSCGMHSPAYMEEALYNLVVNGNAQNLMKKITRIKRFYVQTGAKTNEKHWKLLSGVLPRSIEGNVTASKPQALEEAINIAQRLMDQVTKHAPMQVSSDNKRKFDDRRTFNNSSRSYNNYRNTKNCYNNHQQ
ncbi:hypothetical protein Tco_1371106 [Tanacetum coccineum]